MIQQLGRMFKLLIAEPASEYSGQRLYQYNKEKFFKVLIFSFFQKTSLQVIDGFSCFQFYVYPSCSL